MGAVGGQLTHMPEEVSEGDRFLKERLALNEAIERDVNTTKADLLEAADAESVPPQMFWCECSRAACEERLEINEEEWKRVRSDPHLFFIVEGHEDSRISRVVERTDRFWVVEKTDAIARGVVERTDPAKHPLLSDYHSGT